MKSATTISIDNNAYSIFATAFEEHAPLLSVIPPTLILTVWNRKHPFLKDWQLSDILTKVKHKQGADYVQNRKRH